MTLMTALASAHCCLEAGSDMEGDRRVSADGKPVLVFQDIGADEHDAVRSMLRCMYTGALGAAVASSAKVLCQVRRSSDCGAPA